MAQHQCLIVHKSLQKTTLTLQYTIHSLPFCGCVQWVLVWLIESGSLQEKETRIRVSLVQESQHSLFERVVRQLRWIDDFVDVLFSTANDHFLVFRLDESTG